MISAELITLTLGNKVLLYQGYTFSKRYPQKGPIFKWVCSNKMCKCFLLTDENHEIYVAITDHDHPKKIIFRICTGEYMRSNKILEE